MVKVCEKLFGRAASCKKARNKRGFGIVEALIAAAVLGFLYMAVMNLQSGNHDALLRIRGRDGATEVAQNIIDSLGALGIAGLSDDKLVNCNDNANTYCPCEPGLRLPEKIVVSRTWKGQPGVIEHDMKVEYTATVTVSSDADYMAKTSSMFLGTDSIEHVYAKRLDVKVCWHFKSATPSIKVSGVIR